MCPEQGSGTGFSVRKCLSLQSTGCSFPQVSFFPKLKLSERERERERRNSLSAHQWRVAWKVAGQGCRGLQTAAAVYYPVVGGVALPFMFKLELPMSSPRPSTLACPAWICLGLLSPIC
jgi:hypothetical protein